ncbi:MAG TPA: polysaccharide deacetylase family protein [Solirubrobacteraceae bacterium]|nr:polysaccharide deacetylase family protein [Solirubrobacteraceae bacterium]
MNVVYLRRRAVAIGALMGLVLALVALVRGDAGSPFPGVDSALAPAEKAKLPWRQRYASGSAGPLDARGLPAAPAQRSAVARLHRLGLPIYCGGGRANYAALTFDDGPSQYSEQVMDQMRRAGAQATFFIVGRVIRGREDVVREQVRFGGVADHTWTHANLPTLGNRELRAELLNTKREIERATREPVTLFRPPYGARDARVDRAVRRLGMVSVIWDVDTRDSAGAGSAEIAANADSGMRPGSIILMHDTYDRSLAALPQILQAARRKGIRLVSVPQMLALDPPSEAQVRAGGEGCGDERERFQVEADATAMRLDGR